MTFTRVTLWNDGSVTISAYSAVALALLDCARTARVGNVLAMVLTGGDETFYVMGDR